MEGGVRIDALERSLLEALDAGEDPLDAWRAYRAVAADVLDYYEASFGAPDRPAAAVAAAVAEQAPTLRRRERTLQLDVLAPQVAALLELPPGAGVEAVTFVGWDRALAWCDDEAEEPRAYFALERLPDAPEACRSLGAHELAHLAHFRLRPGEWPPWSVLGGIVGEAIAIWVSRTLVAGIALVDRLFLQPDALDRYAQHRPAVHGELLSLLDVVDEATYRRALFPPWLCEGDVAGVNETGYVVAAALGDAWDTRGITPAQAARLSLARARADLVALLAA